MIRTARKQLGGEQAEAPKTEQEIGVRAHRCVRRTVPHHARSALALQNVTCGRSILVTSLPLPCTLDGR
jgi:hypothetical protein